MAANPENPDYTNGRVARSPFVFAAAALIGAASVASLLLFTVVAALRLRFPFELEWLEGLVLDHVRRVVAGLPVYPPPSLDFIPAVYAPFYYYVAAAAGGVFGDGFFPLRLVSFTAALGCFAVIFEIVRRETRAPLWAVFAAGLFAAANSVCGYYLDLARVDSLFLFFFLATVLLVRFGESAALGVAAGLLAAAATFTKQSAAPALAPLLCWAVCYRRQRAWPLLATFAAASAATVWLLDRASAGWFWRYCFVYPSQQPLTAHSPAAFWTGLVFGHLPIAAVAAASFLVAGQRARRNAETWFYAALLLGAGVTSWLTYLKAGAVDNSLLPAAAALAIVAALGFADAAGRAFAMAWRRRLAAATIGALCLAQFALLRYDPAALIPSAADAAAGARLLSMLRVFPGDVFIVAHGYLGPSIGKRSHSHLMSWQDVFCTRDEATKRALEAEITAAFERGQFDAIVLDGLYYPFVQTILKRYRLRGQTRDFPKQMPWPNFLFVRNDLAPP
jgi:4-amino-4-deoxy-L-arabinose transferase-like glycosyltransferase